MRLAGILISASAIWALSASPAFAQAAAETAIITGTTGAATAQGSRSVGSAAGGAMNRAANTIRSRGGSSNRRARRGGGSAPVVIGTGDPLENSDAEVQNLGNGTRVRNSGGLRPPAANRCMSNCLKPVPAKEKPAE